MNGQTQFIRPSFPFRPEYRMKPSRHGGHDFFGSDVFRKIIGIGKQVALKGFGLDSFAFDMGGILGRL